MIDEPRINIKEMDFKRFSVFSPYPPTDEEVWTLYDNETACFYEIHDSQRNVELLCERLNKMASEHQELKNFAVEVAAVRCK